MPVKVRVDDQVVTVNLSGTDAWWAVRRRLVIPTMRIVDARVMPTEEAERDRGLRVVGTHLPGRLTAGLYRFRGRRGARQIWSVQRADEVLVIDTDIHGTDRVVLEHPGRHDLAWWIGERIPTRSA